jgi:glycosyltransferase involved in cell wall biosynthesis
MKVALVHDFLREYGGAERVLEATHEMYPQAPVYTSFVDWKALGDHAYRFKNWDIRPSWVQNNWFVKKFHSPLRFLAPRVWESFDLSDYDVVISSSGWFMCRGVRTGSEAGPVGLFLPRTPTRGPLLGSPSAPATRLGPLHICYIHHPPRNLYGYATGSDLQKYWIVRAYATIINFFLRHYDYETAQRVDYFVANSKETARRVQKFYRRDSTVIYPPATQAKFAKALRAGPPGKYFLSVGRLTYAKRVDLAIQACNKLKLPLKIVGSGKEETFLRSIAGPTIEFLGSVSDTQLDDVYAGARACIFCALDEDFGIVPVEAMAHSVPVIGLGEGGTLETVVEGKTGVLFSEPTVDSLTLALWKFLRMKKDWTRDCIAHSQKFSKERFERELGAFVREKIHTGKKVL